MRKLSRIDTIGHNGGEGLHYSSSASIFHDQAAFLEAGDVDFPNINNIQLAEELIHEEYAEWIEELEYGSGNDIKEAMDLIYVLAQYVNTLIGPDKALQCWDALHNNNMSKCIDGKLVKREDGKILKPDSYKKLDMGAVLKCLNV